MDATFELARNFAKTTFNDLPEAVVDASKKQILDLIGIAIGGMNERGIKELAELIIEWGGKEESTIVGLGKKVPAPNAAQMNASMAHALDYDDVHETAIIHPGVIAIPTSFAVAEKIGNVSGQAYITAVALGVDMMCRLALATMPGESVFQTGWHLTSIYGYLGAAAIAAKVLGLDEEKMVHAMGIAYHQCGGNGQGMIDGGLTKRLGPGFSVRGGIAAALMAEKGVTGAQNCLEGEMGLYRVYFGNKYDRAALIQNLGEDFEGPNVAIKPYPCCRGIHAAIDAALGLAKENHFEPDDIDAVTVFVTEDTRYLLCTPFEAKCKPRNQVDTQFSVPWGVATALAKKRATLADFSQEAITDEKVLSITSKLRIEVDNSLKIGGKAYPTRIDVTTTDQNIHSKTVINPLGGLEAPMSFDDCARKFSDCAHRIGNEKIDRIIETVSTLEKKTNVSELIDLLTV